MPVREIPVSKLIWHMDVPVWPDETGPYHASPNQVLSDPVRFAEEAARIKAADLSYPLEVFENKGRLMILDGIHRLARAVTEGQTEMRVRFAPDAAVTRLTKPE